VPRLAPLTPAVMTQEQRALYERILQGPRGTSSAGLIDSQGAIRGPFGPMLCSPEVGEPLQALGTAIRFQTSMDPFVRECITLLVARHEASSYEWRSHEDLARAAGVTEKDLTKIRGGEIPALSDPVRLESLNFALTVLKDDLDDDADVRFSSALDERTMVEIVVLIGYYQTLAKLLRVFKID